VYNSLITIQSNQPEVTKHKMYNSVLQSAHCTQLITRMWVMFKQWTQNNWKRCGKEWLRLIASYWPCLCMCMCFDVILRSTRSLWRYSAC